MQYYNVQFNGKDLKPAVIKWMEYKELDKNLIISYKKTKDWRTSSTMGAIASCLLKGMPEQRDDFNNGSNIKEWLLNSINTTIEASKADIEDEDAEK